MSLLTEKQIQDLYLHLDNVSTTTKMKEVIQNWNEKQPARFEPDWSEAPIDAVKASISITWTTPDGYTETYSRGAYTKPVIAHPHASLIAKFAEVAARRVDPWVEFEIKYFDTGSWTALNIPLTFFEECEYRHIGDQ